jgi:hypothetical protein
MSLVYLLTTARRTDFGPLSNRHFNNVLNSAKNDRIQKHKLTNSAEEADIILFIGSRFLYHFDISSSEYYRRFPEKCLVYDLQDYTLPRIPGIYTDIPSYLHDIPLYKTGFYIQVSYKDHISYEDFSDCKYLFSFAGSSKTSPIVRQKILDLDHPRAFLKDTSKASAVNSKDYADLLRMSKFILCPRGISASSYRCFEAMKAGRAPVIIADNWVEPPGIDWDSFSIRVPESEIHKIPDILEEFETKAEMMGEKAIENWENNFSLESGFNWLVDSCLDIKRSWPYYQDLAFRSLFQESLNNLHLKYFLKDSIRFRLNIPYPINN